MRISALLVMLLGVASAAWSQTPDGSALFETRCASCHTGSDPRVPTVAMLGQRTPESIVDALTGGVMAVQGSELTVVERRAVADYLTRNTVASTSASPVNAACAESTRPFSLGDGPQWIGWGPGTGNTRFQPADQAQLTPAQVPQLKLKWAFGFPDATSARALPTVAGGRVFVGSQNGTVYSLDAASGCIYWTFRAAAAVRSGIRLEPRGAGATAYFGDGRARVYAVDAATGRPLWVRQLDEHPSAHVTGTPIVFEDRLFVSIASGEEGQGGNAKYECCTFRGSVASLDASNGLVVWKTYTIDQEPRTIGRNKSGTVRWGPSGAGVWASPTIDTKRRLVYGATGNNYTEPAQTTSDAVMAFAMDTGKVVWSVQLTPDDVFVVGCGGANPGPNCPEGVGPDFDFGNPPMLTTVNGRDLIVIGQKSGIGWALDPDRQGAVVWQYRAAKGSALGGMEFGSALDGVNAYFPVADTNQPTAGELHAVRLDSGERAWMAPPRPLLCGERGRGCTPAILAAITVIPGVVFAGSQDGGIRAYSTTDGTVLWEYDTNRDFNTVNGVSAKGASINGPGPVVAAGMLFINSGYGALGGRPGNVLLAFGVQ